MAYEMKIRGTESEVKIRSPWAAALLPMYDLGQSPTNSLLALFPGGLILVPALITYWRGTKRVMGASQLAGKEPLNGWIAILLYLLLAPGFWAYIQVSLNDVWRREAEALPGHEPPPESSPEMPTPLPPEQQTPPPPS